ncbi:uncharacterized protein CEXT_382811 [Caerostris extrusa]|uniref:Uncharacterized protein n=1 Tax=Caerostris extrusa TaxID=172846 RepID=A0AAV4M469_CAEEX|nr:uncharacterized protein CEXT_382811 [Caerostris extrusa]
MSDLRQRISEREDEPNCSVAAEEPLILREACGEHPSRWQPRGPGEPLHEVRRRASNPLQRRPRETRRHPQKEGGDRLPPLPPQSDSLTLKTSRSFKPGKYSPSSCLSDHEEESIYCLYEVPPPLPAETTPSSDPLRSSKPRYFLFSCSLVKNSFRNNTDGLTFAIKRISCSYWSLRNSMVWPVGVHIYFTVVVISEMDHTSCQRHKLLLTEGFALISPSGPSNNPAQNSLP